ncbi:MAG: hypothetical protein IK016_04360 [Lachnospiraceae bacterium]|nr:hypothetical protein [Lachnospiraceae bacterium]
MTRKAVSVLTLVLAAFLFASAPMHVYAGDDKGDKPANYSDIPPGEQSTPAPSPAPVTSSEPAYTPPSPPPDPDIVKPKRESDGEMEQNRGAIENNSGNIKENFGTIAYNTGTVEHHFWNMNTAMSPGDYSISYGEGFRMEKDADGKLRFFLEAGTEGVVTILPPEGQVITKVVCLVNGVEVVLEPLGGGKYKISAPGMPVGPDGFAMNEGGIIVLTEEGTDAGAAADREQKWGTFNSFYDGKAPGFAELVALDAQRNGKKGGIRIEGIPEGRTKEDVLQELAERPDVQLAMANALLTAAEGKDESLTFITADGVRVTTSLSALRGLLTHFLPAGEPEDSGETVIYHERTFQELTEEERLEKIQKIIQGTTEDFYILDYNVEKGDLEITIIFENDEVRKKFEQEIEVYVEDGGGEFTISTKTEFEVYCEQIGLDLNNYFNNPHLFVDGTFNKDWRYRVRLHQDKLPKDLLDGVPLDYRDQVLQGLENGILGAADMQQKLTQVMGADAAQELMQRWQQEEQKLRDQIQRTMTSLDLPVEMLNTDQFATLSYAQLKEELNRIRNSTAEQRKTWLEVYNKQKQIEEDKRRAEEAKRQEEEEKRKAEEERQRKLQQNSQELLAKINMPSDLLKDIPLENHVSLIAWIQAGTLNSAEHRAYLEKMLGKQKADQLVNQVRQAQVNNSLENSKMPANLLQNYNISDQEFIVNNMNNLEAGHIKPVLEARLGKDGYQALLNNVYTAMAANQPAELPKDLPKLKQLPPGVQEAYIKMYQTGTVKQRQDILNQFGYY